MIYYLIQSSPTGLYTVHFLLHLPNLIQMSSERYGFANLHYILQMKVRLFKGTAT